MKIHTNLGHVKPYEPTTVSFQNVKQNAGIYQFIGAYRNNSKEGFFVSLGDGTVLVVYEKGVDGAVDNIWQGQQFVPVDRLITISFDNL